MSLSEPLFGLTEFSNDSLIVDRKGNLAENMRPTAMINRAAARQLTDRFGSETIFPSFDHQL